MKLIGLTPPSQTLVKQWQKLNKQNSGNRKANKETCLNCEADSKTCANDLLDGKCNYFKEI